MKQRQVKIVCFDIFAAMNALDRAFTVVYLSSNSKALLSFQSYVYSQLLKQKAIPIVHHADRGNFSSQKFRNYEKRYVEHVQTVGTNDHSSY